MSTSRESLILFTILTASLVLSSQSDDSEKLSDFLSSSPKDDTPGNNSGPAKLKTCTTDDCKKISQLFAETMDKNIDPCQDFYGYMCGGWNRTLSIRLGSSRFDRHNYVDRMIDQSATRMVKSPLVATDILLIQHMKKHYQSCINAQQSDALRTIISLFDAIGGWPMTKNIDDWNEDAQSWQKVDTYFANLSGIHTFFRVYTDYLPHDSVTSIPWSNWVDAEDVSSIIGNYSKFQKKVKTINDKFTSHTEAHVSDEQLEKDIADLFNFTRLFSDLVNHSRGIGPRLMNMTTWIDHWESLVGSEPDPKTVINWREIVQRHFDVYNMTINNATEMIVPDSYYEGLLELLRATDKRTIVNFICWKFIYRLLGELSQIMITPTGNNRAEYCVEQSKIGAGLAYWLVNEYIPDYDRNVKDVRTLVTNLQKELALQINNSICMSDSFKLNMQKKLDGIKYEIGAPGWSKNRSGLDSVYQHMVIGDDYVMNMINSIRFEKLYRHLLNDLIMNTYWLISPTGVYPYVLHGFLIYLPSGLIQLPMFSSDVPEYINYGALGVIIAHEMGHALYSKVMTDQSMHEEYKGQFECVPDLFREFYKSEEAISVMRSRNVADAIGMSVAFSNYKRLKQNGEINVTLTVPGFEDFTDEQMFFMSFGQAFCEIVPPNYTLDPENSRGLSKLRVNTVISISPEFAKTFNCSAVP